MFMGDAGIDKERDILNKYNLPDIDVLKVGHHGSKTSSGKKFIDEINPKYSVISVGKNNRYGHPNKEDLINLINKMSEEEIKKLLSNLDNDLFIKYVKDNEEKEYILKNIIN